MESLFYFKEFAVIICSRIPCTNICSHLSAVTLEGELRDTARTVVTLSTLRQEFLRQQLAKYDQKCRNTRGIWNSLVTHVELWEFDGYRRDNGTGSGLTPGWLAVGSSVHILYEWKLN